MAVLCFYQRGKINFTRNKKIFLVVSFLAIVFILGMRADTVGVDTHSYHTIFDKVSDSSFTEILRGYYYLNIEVGYIILMKATSIFGGYYLFQIVIATIACVLFAKFIADNFENYFLGVILFLGFEAYLLLFNISRQMLAVALIANCWSVLNQNKKVKAFILFICAGVIHTTAWIFIVIYMVYLLRNNKFIVRSLPIIGIIGIFSYEKILRIVSTIVPHYANYYGNHKVVLEIGFAVAIWMIVAIISLYLIITNIKMSNVKIEKKKYCVKRYSLLSWDTETYLYSGFALFYVAANVIGLSFNYFERLGCYFIPFVMIVFERFGIQIKTTVIRRLYYCGLVICFITYFIVSSKTEQYLYNFFWDI